MCKGGHFAPKWTLLDNTLQALTQLKRGQSPGGYTGNVPEMLQALLVVAQYLIHLPGR